MRLERQINRKPRVGPTVSVGVASTVEKLMDQVYKLTVPDELAEAPLSSRDITARVAQDIWQAAKDIALLNDLSVFLDLLQFLVNAAPSETSSIRLIDEPDKAATIYENEDDIARAEQAVAEVHTVLKVASALATKLGESLDDAKVRQHKLIRVIFSLTDAALIGRRIPKLEMNHAHTHAP